MTSDLANEPATRLNHVRQTDRESGLLVIRLSSDYSDYYRRLDLEEGRLVVKQLRALDWMAIDGASCKQNSSDPSPNSPGESNQTFMLNHETIRMESANKRAGSPISPPPLKPSSGHLTLLFTRPQRTKS
ncbi:hypothetical protein G5I_14742 [Acromyrmex echinatior]|uniref:Uncharacterized protein n=1 Tax=Acromyrmex echinatior TaxID=103372 RepID=F4X8K3_ACREC|nr:hypothetical protein G5I_14742 [Acromyrmex echinatior]